MIQLRTVKIALLVAVVSAIGAVYTFAQQRTIETKFFTVTVDEPLSTSLQADVTQRLTNGSLKLLGSVVIVVNGVRITADSGVFHPETNVIDVNGGNVRIELPSSPTPTIIEKPR